MSSLEVCITSLPGKRKKEKKSKTSLKNRDLFLVSWRRPLHYFLKLLASVAFSLILCMHIINTNLSKNISLMLLELIFTLNIGAIVFLRRSSSLQCHLLLFSFRVLLLSSFAAFSINFCCLACVSFVSLIYLHGCWCLNL